MPRKKIDTTVLGKSTLTDPLANSLTFVGEDATALVYLRQADGTNGAAATVFANAQGVVVESQPLNADSNGRLPGWVDRPEDYNVEVTLGGTTWTEPMDAPDSSAATAIADTGVPGGAAGNAIDLDATLGILTASIPITATPQIRKLTLSATAMTDQLVLDTAHGDPQYYFSETFDGQRWEARHGASGSPVTVEGPTFKISRYENYASPVSNGANFPRYSALHVVNVGGPTTNAQPVAGSFVARSSSDVGTSFPGVNSDATAVIGSGIVTAGGTGRALGAYFQGLLTATASSSATFTGAEIMAVNNSGTDSTYSATLPGLNTRALFLTSGGSNKPTSACEIGHSGGARFLFGIVINGQNAIATTSFQDDSNAPTSMKVNGGHSVAAIAVAPTAGKALFGVTSSALATRGLFDPYVNTDSALTVRGHATQSVNIFQVLSSANAELVGIGPTGNLRMITGHIGIGTTTMTAALNLQTSAITDRVIDDTFHDGAGDWTGGPEGTRYEIRHGGTGSPEAGSTPTMRILRLTEHTGALLGGVDVAALTVKVRGLSGSTSQIQAGSFYSQSFSTQTPSGSVVPDAQAVSGIGELATGAKARSIGGFFYGRLNSDCDSTGATTALEAGVQNNRADHTINTAGSGAGSQSMGLWVPALSYQGGPGYRSAAGLQFGASTGSSWQVGIYVGFKSTGSIVEDATFRDFGQANWSIDIDGPHANAAIGIGPGSGGISIGRSSKFALAALDLGWDAAGTASTVAADGLLLGNDTTLYRGGASILKTDDFFFAHNMGVWGTAGAGYVSFVTQSTTLPGPNNVVYVGDSGGTTTLRFKDSAGAVTILGAAGSGGTLSTTSNSSTIDFSASTSTNVTGSVIASSITGTHIATTSTVQVAGLGIGVASPATGLGITNAATGQSATQGLFATTAGVVSINKTSGNFLQFYDTSTTAGTTARFQVILNADLGIHLRWRDSTATNDGGLGGNTTNLELYKVWGANTLKTSNSFEAVTSLIAGTGGVTTTGPLISTGTGGAGTLQLSEQSSAPSASAAIAKVYVDLSTVSQLRVRFATNDRILMRDVALVTFTQTYATADATLGAYTSDPESSAYTGLDNLQVGTPYAKLTDLNSLRVAYENLRAFTEDLAAFTNSLVDALQGMAHLG